MSKSDQASQADSLRQVGWGLWGVFLHLVSSVGQFVLLVLFALGLEVGVHFGKKLLPEYLYFWGALQVLAAIVFLFDAGLLIRSLCRHWSET